MATISPGCLWNTLPEDCREVEFKNLQVIVIPVFIIKDRVRVMMMIQPQQSLIWNQISLHFTLFFFVVDGLVTVLDSINKQTNKGRRHWVHHYRLCYRGQCKDERGDYQGDYFFLRLLRILLSEMVIIMCWVWWWFWGNNLKNLVFIDDANHH